MGQSGKVTPVIAPMRTQQFGCKNPRTMLKLGHKVSPRVLTNLAERKPPSNQEVFTMEDWLISPVWATSLRDVGFSGAC